MDEKLITNIAQALKFGSTIDNIHNILENKGFTENEIFLAIKAGEIFLKHCDAYKKTPVSFGREMI